MVEGLLAVLAADRHLADLDRADVKRRFALALNLVVVDVRAFADDDFGDGVGEIFAVAQGDVALYEHPARMAAGDDEVPGMRHRISVRHEQQMDRLVDHGVGVQLDEGAIGDERSIERRESVLIEFRDASEVALDCLGFGTDRMRQTRDLHSIAHTVQ